MESKYFTFINVVFFEQVLYSFLVEVLLCRSYTPVQVHPHPDKPAHPCGSPGCSPGSLLPPVLWSPHTLTQVSPLLLFSTSWLHSSSFSHILPLFTSPPLHFSPSSLLLLPLSIPRATPRKPLERHQHLLHLSILLPVAAFSLLDHQEPRFLLPLLPLLILLLTEKVPHCSSRFTFTLDRH